MRGSYVMPVLEVSVPKLLVTPPLLLRRLHQTLRESDLDFLR